MPCIRRLEYGQRWKTSKRGHFSVEDLVLVGTKNGATSLGLKRHIGEISPGYEADFVILDTKASDFGNDQGALVGNEFLASALYGCESSNLIFGTAVAGKLQLNVNHKSPSGSPAADAALSTSKSNGTSPVTNGSGPAIGVVLTPEQIAILKHKKPDIIDLTRTFIDIDSVSGTEKIMADAMEIW